MLCEQELLVASILHHQFKSLPERTVRYRRASPPCLKPRRKRRPSIGKIVAAAEKAAEKAGKNLTSITLPDGTVLHFGASEPTAAVNPWLADLDKVTKQ